jgi:hypothetical protein
MLVKSNSVPNFLFETPQHQKTHYTFKLNKLPKVIPYSEFLRNNPNIIKTERRQTITTFYNSLLHK